MYVFVRSVTLAFNLDLYEGMLFYQPQILGIADTYQAPTGAWHCVGSLTYALSPRPPFEVVLSWDFPEATQLTCWSGI